MDKKIKWQSQHIEDEYEDEEEEDTGYNEYGQPPKPEEVMATPLGMFKINNKYNPYRQMEIWVGHCNFPISENIFNIIDNTLGVEFFKVITPYRFLIAPAQMFDWRDVRARLEKNVCGKSSLDSVLKDVVNTDLKIKIKETYTELSKYKYWAMYVFPNGRQDVYFSNDESEEFNRKVNLYKESQQESGGIFLSSE